MGADDFDVELEDLYGCMVGEVMCVFLSFYIICLCHQSKENPQHACPYIGPLIQRT